MEQRLVSAWRSFRFTCLFLAICLIGVLVPRVFPGFSVCYGGRQPVPGKGMQCNAVLPTTTESIVLVVVGAAFFAAIISFVIELFLATQRRTKALNAQLDKNYKGRTPAK